MEPIRWGILGTANIARNAYVPVFAESADHVVAAIASRSLEKAKAFSQEFSIPKAYGGYDALIADPDIDAVYIPLPVNMHCQWSLRCAEAGKAVLVEKPAALDAAQARQMVDAFAARNLLFAEALIYRYHPLNAKALALVREGAIGELHMVRASFNAMATAADDIRLRKETGGGALLDVGSYCVSLIRSVVGEEPSAVKAMARMGEVDESLTALLRFPSGVLGYLGCGIRTQFDCSYEISGDKARIAVYRGATCAWPGEAFVLQLHHGDDMEEIVCPAANAYAELLKDFTHAYRNQGPLQYGAEDAVNNLKVIDAILASL